MRADEQIPAPSAIAKKHVPLIQWDYEAVVLEGVHWLAGIQELGVEGWELVAVLAMPDGVTAFFKRRKLAA